MYKHLRLYFYTHNFITLQIILYACQKTVKIFFYSDSLTYTAFYLSICLVSMDGYLVSLNCDTSSLTLFIKFRFYTYTQTVL